MSDTPRFQLPFILPGQAQKEVYHNEALVRVDAALHPAVEEAARSDPPEAPESGQNWLIGEGATGAWHGRAGELAAWTEGGWRFLAPTPGMTIWIKTEACWHHWNGSEWRADHPVRRLEIGGVQVVGPRQPAVLSPSGGTIIDAEARASINAIIATLMSHGLTD